jgi:bud emergence protein 1
MPGPVTYVTDTISNGRRESLDDYVKRLLALPPYISRCQLVRQLFAPREGDFELDPNALQEDYRLSGTSQQSSSVAQSQNQSHDQLNGNNGYGQQQQQSSSVRANQPWSQDSYSQPSYSQDSQQQGQGGYNPASSDTALMPPPPGSTPSNSGSLKIKVWFEDDCIAIRVPADIDFETLRDKLMDRLKVREQLLVQYKDEPSGATRLMSCDEDLEVARQRNPRLQLYVGYAWDGQR